MRWRGSKLRVDGRKGTERPAPQPLGGSRNSYRPCCGTGLAPPPGRMSEGQQFHSGGVLRRARAVLTFATAIRVDPTRHPRVGAAPPTLDPVSLPSALLPQGSLPVISRIVRGTGFADLVRLPPMGRGVVALKRVGLGSVLFAALGLAILARAAAPRTRSLSEEGGLATATAEERVTEASARESLLACAVPPSRVEGPAPAAPARIPSFHLTLAVRPRAHPTHGVPAHSHACPAAHPHPDPAARQRAPSVHGARHSPSTVLGRNSPIPANIRR
jgi:hypothetical protein